MKIGDEIANEEKSDKTISLETARLLLTPLSLIHAREKYYLRWLQDADVIRFLETRLTEQTQESIEDYVKSVSENLLCFPFAIYRKNENDHIGNIKLGAVNSYHRFAEVSYFIGDVPLWNNGYMTEALIKVCNFGFENLKLDMIIAGVYESNGASIRVLEKAGFKKEAVFVSQLVLEDTKEDHQWWILRRTGK